MDTSVVIKLAKIKKGEALQQIEIDRCTRLRELVFKLVRDGKMLCPESDQEEEYAALRMDDDVHRMFSQLSLGIALTHRQGIFDNHVFKGMEAFAKKSDTIHLPSRSYFHGDPVRRLQEARKERFIISVGPLKDSELLKRRATAKEQTSRDWENLRQKLVAGGKTFDEQQKLEEQGYWDGLTQLVKQFEIRMFSGSLDFLTFMGAQGPLLYRTVWKEMGGQPQGWQGLDEFFRSEYFAKLPAPFIGSRMTADLLTGHEPIANGDVMDIDLLEVALPVSHFVVTDRRMELRIKKLKLDTTFGVQVFSMQTIGALFAELEKLQ